MDVAAAVVTVRVRADQSLVTGKKALGKFSAERLRFLTGQTAFRYILRIETDDVMMGFDFAARLVFVKIRACDFRSRLGAACRCVRRVGRSDTPALFHSSRF